MNYQVFNPLAGTYAKCATKEEARATLVKYIQEFCTLNPFLVEEKIVNEHGDYAWIPSAVLNKTLVVS